MGYYMGDFYAVGDPGIGSFFAGLAKKAVGFIPGVGPAISGALEAVLPGGVRRTAAAAGGAVARATSNVRGAILKHPVLSAAGAAGAAGALAGGMGGRMMAPAAGSMRGYHIEKRGKHAGQLIRNRRMRVTNPKALRRAIRRTTGFAKLAMRTIHLVHPKKKVRFGGFRRGRARARS